MKLAFSNIGWATHDDPSVLGRLRAAGVTGIEVAPTKVWPEWGGASEGAARRYGAFLGSLGLEVPAMQAILFGRPDLALFDRRPERRAAFVDHVRAVADLAAGFGARAMVYGAPKSRLRGPLDESEAEEIAVEVFSSIAPICAERGTCLCIEPNPTAYGCDFVTDSASALRLVRKVGLPGFGLHLDAAALVLANESLGAVLDEALPWLRHYHISEPFLVGFDEPKVPHAENLARLRSSTYAGWVSVEVDGQKHDLDRTLDFLVRLGASE